MPKSPKLFDQTNPYTSAYYYQDNLRFLEATINTVETYQSQQPHLHDELELMLILEGRGTLHVNGLTYPARDGSMILTYPYHVHHLEVEKGTALRYQLCRFSLSMMVYLGSNKKDIQTNVSVLEYAPPLIQLEGEGRRRVEAIFEELFWEERESKHDYQKMLLACVMQLMVLFDRNALKVIEQGVEEARPVAWNALQYIHMHFHLNLTAVSVGEVFDMSPRELNSALRMLTGMNFGWNLAAVRIRNACAMMQFEELSLPFIAKSVGYTAMPAFFRHFKEHKGMTPNQYRQEMMPAAPAWKKRFSDSAQAVIFYISENYREEITLSDASKALYISEATIENLLEKSVGLRFSQMLTKTRLLIAAGLLVSTTIPVYDVAIAVGFRSIRTFNRNFTEEFSATPTQYRQGEHRTREDAEKKQISIDG